MIGEAGIALLSLVGGMVAVLVGTAIESDFRPLAYAAGLLMAGGALLLVVGAL